MIHSQQIEKYKKHIKLDAINKIPAKDDQSSSVLFTDIQWINPLKYWSSGVPALQRNSSGLMHCVECCCVMISNKWNMNNIRLCMRYGRQTDIPGLHRKDWMMLKKNAWKEWCGMCSQATELRWWYPRPRRSYRLSSSTIKKERKKNNKRKKKNHQTLYLSISTAICIHSLCVNIRSRYFTGNICIFFKHIKCILPEWLAQERRLY